MKENTTHTTVQVVRGDFVLSFQKRNGVLVFDFSNFPNGQLPMFYLDDLKTVVDQAQRIRSELFKNLDEDYKQILTGLQDMSDFIEESNS